MCQIRKNTTNIELWISQARFRPRLSSRKRKEKIHCSPKIYIIERLRKIDWGRESVVLNLSYIPLYICCDFGAVVLALIIYQAFIFIYRERPRYQNTHFLYAQIETEPLCSYLLYCAHWLYINFKTAVHLIPVNNMKYNSFVCGNTT
jgi:hypothetical protein